MPKMGDRVLVVPKHWVAEFYKDSFKVEYGRVIGFSQKDVVYPEMHGPITLLAVDIELKNGGFKHLTCMEADLEDFFTKSEFINEIYREIVSNRRAVERIQSDIDANIRLEKTLENSDVLNEIRGNIDYCKAGVQRCQENIKKLETLANKIEAEWGMADLKREGPIV